MEKGYGGCVDHRRSSASDSRILDSQCIPVKVIDFEDGNTFENESSSERYLNVGDVSSVAWGVCGETYNRHEDALFREILFVSGQNGVTVHIFREQNNDAAVSGNELEDEFLQGSWVEWGPSMTQVQGIKGEEPGSRSDDISRSVDHVNHVNRNCEIPESNGVSSKTWLRSFLTAVEDIESDGGRWTEFPKRSSFPCSAKAVSFRILGDSFPLLHFLKDSPSLDDREYLNKRFHDSEHDTSSILNSTSPASSSVEPDLPSTRSGIGSDSLYKCTRVFSSDSDNYIGFALTLVDPRLVDKPDETINALRNVVLIARLASRGIQWVSLIKLEQNQNVGPGAEWADFRFSGDLLVSLSSHGFVVCHSAKSGVYVAQLDILRTSLLKPEMNMQEQGPRDHSFGKRVFTRLIADAQLLAAVDEYGVVYVISLDRHLEDKENKNGAGVLAGWEVGGSDISCQRDHRKLSDNGDSRFPPLRDRYISSLHNVTQSIHHWNLHGKKKRHTASLSGFSAASEIAGQAICETEPELHFMRTIFLPTYRLNVDDGICFSPFGITRLIRKHNTEDQDSGQIFHLNLYADSSIRDDNCLSKYRMLSPNKRKGGLVGDAIGCTLHGCFYLVTERGLSVVLPSVSVSSSFLHVESIAYRPWEIKSGLENPVKDNLEIKESEKSCEPWTIEVLDRVLLYESVEEAERLCSENGNDLSTFYYICFFYCKIFTENKRKGRV